MEDKIPPITPGEILMEEFLEPMGITQNKLAVSIGVPPRRINEIVHGTRRITADTALRLGRFCPWSRSLNSTALPRRIWPDPPRMR